MNLHAPSKTKTRVKYLLHRMEQGWSPMCDNVPAEGDEWGVMKAGCANGPQFDPTQNKRLPPDVIPATEYEIKVGDVIMSRANTTELLGSAALVKQTPPRLLLCDKLYRLVVDEGKKTPEYLVHWLRSTDARCQMEAEATGASASMQNIGHDTVRNLKLVVPPLADQRRIAAYLDAETRQMDALVAEKEAMLKLLEEKRAAQISHAVTRGLNPLAPLKPSALPWLGDIPKHWEVRRLKHFSLIGNGSTPSVENADYWTEDEDEGFPWLNSSVVNHASVASGSRLVTSLALKECHLPVISPPAVLVGITGQGKTRGMAAILGIQATINQHLAYVKPTSEAECPFLCLALNNAYNFMRSESDGAGSTKGAITCEQLGNVSLPVPPLEEQRAIVAHLAAERERTAGLEAALRESIHLLHERRRALITAAVTGQIAL